MNRKKVLESASGTEMKVRIEILGMNLRVVDDMRMVTTAVVSDQVIGHARELHNQEIAIIIGIEDIVIDQEDTPVVMSWTTMTERNEARGEVRTIYTPVKERYNHTLKFANYSVHERKDLIMAKRKMGRLAKKAKSPIRFL